MYIEPNTVIKFLSGVKLEPSFQHTIYFANKNAQYNYFNSKVKLQRTDKYFQRHTVGSLIINVPVEELYNCSYMMFQNSAFSDKWFYAFIMNVDYKNNTTSIVYFMIDPIQTWFFDYTIHPSFVLREHSQTDVAGDNIVPETIGADIQYINSVTESKITCEYTSVLHTMYFDEDDAEWKVCPHKDTRSGMITPYSIGMFASDGNMEGYLQKYIDDGQAEAILCCYPFFSDVSISLSRPSIIGTYTPRNKKLLTGQFCKYSFELAGNIMEVPLDAVPSPTVTNRPRNVSVMNYAMNEYRVFLNSYNSATCPTSMSIAIPIEPFKWAYNSYANNANLNKEATAMMLSRTETERYKDIYKTSSDIVAGTAEMFSVKKAVKAFADPGAGIASYTRSASDVGVAAFREYELLSNIDEHSEAISRHRANMSAPATGGSVNSNALMFNDQLYLSGYVWTVLPQDAERIDKFFDMYGYAVNTLKVPNRNFRPHWNYVKTSGLEMSADCPTSDAEFIKKIYENGITFWNNGDEIGDYSLNNSIPVTP